MQQANKYGNTEDQGDELLAPQPANHTTQSSDTAEAPLRAKKTCHAEITLDRTIYSLTAEADKLEDILYMNIISNLEKTLELLKTKKEDIKKAVKKKNTLICNQIDQKAACNRKKGKEKRIYCSDRSL